MKPVSLSVFCLIIVAFFSSCNSHPTAKSNGGAAVDAKVLTMDSSLLRKYREAVRKDTDAADQAVYAKFFDLVKEFNGRRLDTTVLTIGNIDGDKVGDSIFTRIYYESDSIYVESKWIKGKEVMWHYKFTDPYDDLAIALYNDSSRNTWPSFAIGVLYGAPEFRSQQEVDTSVLNLVYDQGVSDLNSAGIKITKEQYKAYLQAFKGDLLVYGDPESREGVWIWYKPAGRLITYYQP